MSDTQSRVDVVSLFGGIGGIDLGLTRGDARLRTILFVEIHADAQRVLRETLAKHGHVCRAQTLGHALSALDAIMDAQWPISLRGLRLRRS